MKKLRVAVDTGGTFTDFVVLDESTGALEVFKVPSTRGHEADGIIGGMRQYLDKLGGPGSDIAFFSHGTTVGTNAILEGKGAQTGLVISEGFRGIYEIGEQSRPYGATTYDLFYEKPKPLVPPRLTEEVTERVLFNGSVLTELDEETVRAAIRRLAAHGVEAAAVCFLFSFRNAAHEKRVGELFAELAPHINVSLSCEVAPQIREYYRLSTTVVNAYLNPLIARYVASLDARLRELGSEGKQHYIMQSNGGVATFKAAAERSVQTILSGPAAGVVAAARMIAEMPGFENVVTFDMGGTSTDVALIQAATPVRRTGGKVHGRDVLVPMLDIHTVAAGGGTLAWIDSSGVLQVGPHSAGADPGPACYGNGGTQPTITDANVVLGYLSADNPLAGGALRLDRGLAERAIKDVVADPLGLSVIEAAKGIIEIVNVKMQEAIKVISSNRGYDMRDFHLLAFGGAGPLHASALATDLGMKGVLVPAFPGAFSALGLLLSDVRGDYVTSELIGIGKVDPGHVFDTFEKLRLQGEGDLLAQGFAPHQLRYEFAFDLRYVGQGYELTIPMPDIPRTPGALHQTRLKFDGDHAQLTGHCAPSEDVEIVNYRITAVALVPQASIASPFLETTDLAGAKVGERETYLDGERTRTTLYDRTKLALGTSVTGPAILLQGDSTTLVHSGQTAVVVELGQIEIRSETAGRQWERAAAGPGTRTNNTPDGAIDPVTFQVIQSRLSGIVKEMQDSIFRTGYSTVVRESQDASCVLLDAAGNVVGEHVILPLHLSCLPGVVTAIRNQFDDDLRPGDAYITNHPYLAGTPHSMDMAVVSPVFAGDRLIAFCASIAHKTDLGGAVPGTANASASDIFGEGIQYPPIRIERDGSIVRDIEAIVRANSRTPDIVMGDIRGQIGVARLGERRLAATIARYGLDATVATFEAMQSIAERRIRTMLTGWPDAIREATKFIDGADAKTPVRFHVRVEKRGDRIHFDFSGSDDQSAAPINIRPPLARGSAAFALIAMLDPQLPNNGGIARVVETTFRSGSILDPLFPAPTNTYMPTANAIVDVCIRALDGFLTERRVSGASGSAGTSIGGTRADGSRFLQYEISGSAFGARNGSDGPSGIAVLLNNARCASIEVLESEFPARVVRWELTPDSGGPGRFRGGLGARRVWRMDAPAAQLTLRGTGHHVAAFGADGGHDGAVARTILNPGTERERIMPGRYSGLQLAPGDVIWDERGGGGGLGDPHERNLERIANDVIDGYVSRAAALRDYGADPAALDGAIAAVLQR